jgi:hypothetical protein
VDGGSDSAAGPSPSPRPPLPGPPPGAYAPVVALQGPPPQSASRRQASPLALGLVAAVLLGGMAVTAVRVVDHVQATAVGSVHRVTTDASAQAGWGPIYVDDEGRPARWDPCTPIPYVVQAGWLPDTGRQDLAEALARLSAASGLRFVDEGDTDEVPSLARSAFQPERYGQRWAPLLIGWVPPATTDLGLGAGAQGMSVAVAVPGRTGPHLVSGQVVLDADNRLIGGFGPGTTEGEVLLHELAHAVGLGHVLDATQVMYPRTTNSESEFGAGDRAGLAAVGAAAGCYPAPQARPLRLASGG